jgi:hypothetical protein
VKFDGIAEEGFLSHGNLRCYVQWAIVTMAQHPNDPIPRRDMQTVYDGATENVLAYLSVGWVENKGKLLIFEDDAHLMMGHHAREIQVCLTSTGS